MSGAGWATAAGFAILLIALAAMAWDSRATRQRLRNYEGELTGLRLDLDAAQERVGELRRYLSQPTNWQEPPVAPVPTRLADETPADRWSSAQADESAEERTDRPLTT